MFELTKAEAKRLGLGKRQEVYWWAIDNAEIEGRKGFYYIPGNLKTPLTLETAHPPFFITRETEIIDGQRRRPKVFIERVPYGGTSQIPFTHYALGESHEYSLSQEASWRGRGTSSFERKVEIAVLHLLRLPSQNISGKP